MGLFNENVQQFGVDFFVAGFRQARGLGRWSSDRLGPGRRDFGDRFLNPAGCLVALEGDDGGIGLGDQAHVVDQLGIFADDLEALLDLAT